MLESVPTAYILAAILYVVTFIGYVVFMRTSRLATWPRVIIAGLVWPITALLACVYIGDNH